MTQGARGGWWDIDPQKLVTNEVTPESAAELGLEIRVQVRRKEDS